MVFCVNRIIDFFKTMKREIIDEIRVFQASRQLSEEELRLRLNELERIATTELKFSTKQEISLIREQLGEELTYMKRPRGYGSGDPRLNNIVPIKDCIYDLCFMCQFSDEIMDKEFDIVTGSLRCEIRKTPDGEPEENLEHEHANQGLGYAINDEIQRLERESREDEDNIFAEAIRDAKH